MKQLYGDTRHRPVYRWPAAAVQTNFERLQISVLDMQQDMITWKDYLEVRKGLQSLWH
jgi:hypothetical protein